MSTLLRKGGGADINCSLLGLGLIPKGDRGKFQAVLPGFKDALYVSFFVAWFFGCGGVDVGVLHRLGYGGLCCEEVG